MNGGKCFFRSEARLVFLHFPLLSFPGSRECPYNSSSSSFSFFGFLFFPIERPLPQCTCVVGECNNGRTWADIQTHKALLHVLVVCWAHAHVNKRLVPPPSVSFSAWFAAWLHYDALQTHPPCWLADCQAHDVTSCCRNYGVVRSWTGQGPLRACRLWALIWLGVASTNADKQSEIRCKTTEWKMQDFQIETLINIYLLPSEINVSWC